MSYQTVEQELEISRKRLLDLTMRNRLLNYRPAKSKTLKIIDKIPAEVYEILVQNERQMEFKPKPAANGMSGELDRDEDQADRADANGDDALTAEEASVVWKLPAQNSVAAGHHTDRFLQTAMEPDALQRRLYRIANLAQSFFEEQGYSILFLALGFLEWKEAPAAEIHRRAPLILVPVELTRAKVNAPYKVIWTGDEVFSNISLIEKLKEQLLDVDSFEMPDNKHGVDEYFQSVRIATKKFPDWKITTDICLDFFSFTKFVLWKDLDKKSWPTGKTPADHPLIQSLLDPEAETDPNDDEFSEDEIDERLHSEDTYHILDADPSQVAVIEAIKAGRNLVVEGPPGTGKSQTIANCIGELLATGKSVLFVSEKMAALEVVKSRLDRLGLGDYCLELHSRKTNKKEFLRELERTVTATPTVSDVDPAFFQRHEELRGRLNEYAEAMRSPVDGLRLTPFQLIGMKENVLRHFQSVGRSLLRLNIQDPERLLPQAWEEAKGKLKDLSRALQIVKPIGSHPWKGTQPGLILPDDEERIGGIVDKCLGHHAKLGEALNRLVISCGVSYPYCVDQISPCIEAAQVVSRSIPMNREVLLNSEWNKPSAQAENLIIKIKTYQDLKESLKLRPPVASETADLDQQRAAFAAGQNMLQWQSAHLAQIAERAGIRLVEFVSDVSGALAAASVVAQSMQVNTALLLNHAWDQQNPLAQDIIQKLERSQANRTKVSGLFNEVTLERDLVTHAEDYLKVSVSFLRIVLPKYYSLKRDIMTWYAVPQKRSSVQIGADLQPLLQYYKTRRDLLAHDDSAKQLFGMLWKGESSDVATLQQFSNWILRFRQEMLKGTLTENACTVIDRGVDKDALCSVITKCEKELPELDQQMDAVWTSLGTTAEFLIGRPAEKISLSDLETLCACLKVLVEIRKLDHAGKSLFGRIWAGENSSSNDLRAFAEWVVLFRQEILRGALTEQACNAISQGPTKTDIEAARSSALREQDDLITELTKLAKEVGWDIDKAFAPNPSPPLVDLERQLRVWREGLHTLQYWSRYVAVRSGCQNAVTSPVVQAVEAGTLTEPADVLPCFEGNVADALLRVTFKSSPILAPFAGEVHEKKISDFIDVDKELIRLNRLRLLRILIDRKPRIYAQASRESEVGILIGQFNRKRNIMPIRKLMTHAGLFVQKIKPCFMMSPLSIAQFLDPTSVSFDVIIFDEASQVKPEDALGALMRGMQLIVMGDTRQLPPTSFFDRVAEDDTDEDEKAEGTSVADVESILHQCKRRFPYKMLNRHYRSRHESLITVSNVNFYDNKLQVFPASIARGPSLGLQFTYLKDTVYDRGKTGAKNGLEAKAVATAALEHFRKHPDKSLGIGTFSLKQMQAIQDQIELLRKDPLADAYFSANKDEPYFVKNLETIQGDERDVILISVGYGRASDGRLSQNFGPLNSDGGERRLNVLITRARESCVVFANFRAADLKTAGDSPVGVRAFKCFLEYAETGNLPVEHESLRDSDSPFEDSVYAFLCEKRYEVRKQVGCSSFWIDLAVVDPQSLGRYLIGIECDGAMYHSSRVARDRDRLRQQVLEGLHWKLHRVWSTDWYRNREQTQRRLIEAIELAKITPTTDRTQITNPLMDSAFLPKPVEPQNSTGSSANGTTTEIRKPMLQQAPAVEIPPYQQCIDIYIAEGTLLHEMTPRELARAVVQVVNIESPVNVEEVINRIRTLTGFGRAGKRMRDAISSAISVAVSQKMTKRLKNFLWTLPDRPLQLRRRVELPKIEMICDEEILEAIKHVLNLQNATTKQDLILQAARTLGIQRTTIDIGAHIEKVISRSIKSGVLVCRANGAIALS